MASTPRVRIEKGGRVAVLWIENPPRNTMRVSMVSDLMSRVPELEKDDSIRAVVVTGAGSLVFSSGMDIEEWAKLPPKEAQEWVTRGQDAFWALEHLTKPTIAAVAGMARGAGAELALACDIRIADETAIFSHPETDLGWMPSHGGTARLSKIVGRSNALELLLSGKALTALDALSVVLESEDRLEESEVDLDRAVHMDCPGEPRAAREDGPEHLDAARPHPFQEPVAHDPTVRPFARAHLRVRVARVVRMDVDVRLRAPGIVRPPLLRIP